MKNKLNRHLVFWLASTVQGTLLEYAWIFSVYSKEHQISIVVQAILYNLALMPSRLFFTYYALHAVSGKPPKKQSNKALFVLKLLAALLVAVILHRMGSAYYIIPHEFPNRAPYTLAEILSAPWMFISILDIGYVAGVAVALKLLRMQAVSRQREKELIKDKLETELKFLKNQINPHFLFNTLNNIYGLAIKKSDETPNVIVRLANLLRFMLYESAEGVIPLSAEIKVLEDYVQLEKLRYSNRLKVSFDKEIDDYSQLISPFILLPFIENAFKHGVNDTVEAAVIAITIRLSQGLLAFEVKNGNAHTNQGEIKENIGLKNVRRQLELTYTDFLLNITNLENTFTVNLNINLNSNGKL